MRIVVVGAGAIGGVLAVGLHEAGLDVEAVARGEHLAKIQRDGLVRRAPDGEVTATIVAHPNVVAANIVEADLVVLATKTQQAEVVLDDLLAQAGPAVAVACVSNGVEAERLALRRFETVLGVLVNVPAVHLEPGIVEVYATPPRGLLDVGGYPAGVPAQARDFAAAAAAADFLSEAVPDIMRRKWAKLLGNVGNVCQALCGTDADSWRPLYDRLRAEAEAVVRAAGIEPDLETQQRRAALVSRADIGDLRRPGGSSWQSVVRGTGDIETVALNGEITLLGRLHGVPTPANALVQAEALRLVRDGRQPGSISADDLLARLDAVPG